MVRQVANSNNCNTVGAVLKYHILNAKNYGVTQRKMAAVITHEAFWAGCLKAGAAFSLMQEVYGEKDQNPAGKDNRHKELEKTEYLPYNEQKAKAPIRGAFAIFFPEECV